MNSIPGINRTVFAICSVVFVCLPEVTWSQTVKELDSSRDELKESFRHDFAKDGSDPRNIEVANAREDHVVFSEEGATASLAAKGPWSQVDLAARFEVLGDFDIECGFDDLKLSGSDKSCIMLNFSFDNKDQQIGRVIRFYQNEKLGEFQASLVEIKQGERVFHIPAKTETEARSGRLRIARRGTKVFYLVAEGTQDFQILHHQSVAADKSSPNGVVLQAKGNADALAKVTWKYVRIHADKLVSPVRTVDALDADLPRLTSVFEHDFAKSGLDAKYLDAIDRHRAMTSRTDDGLVASVRSTRNYNGIEISTRFEVHGDFDAEVSFESLNLFGDDVKHIMLTADFADQPLSICRLIRTNNKEQQDRVDVSVTVLKDGKRLYSTSDVVLTDAINGRMRLARRGREVSYLFAESDDAPYQLIGRRTVTDAPTIVNGIKIRNLCKGDSTSEVTWKKLTLRAEKLMFHPIADSTRLLAVMNSDGSDLTTIVQPPDGYSKISSPEWSADGKRIVFDASSEANDPPEIYVADADGSNLENLGPGSMPSFAATDDEILFYENSFGVIGMDSDGFGRRQIIQDGLGAQESPDGKYIAWVDRSSLYLWDQDTEESTKLWTAGKNNTFRIIHPNVSWSPDGTMIAVASAGSGTIQLGIVHRDTTTGFRKIHEAEGINRDLSWHPDGKRILFSQAARDGISTEFYIVDSNGKLPARPLPGQANGMKVYDCDWSTDGSRILFTATQLPKPVEWKNGTNTDN